MAVPITSNKRKPNIDNILELDDQSSANNEDNFTDVQWQDQLAKYNSLGMLENDIIQEHKGYVRKVHMIKDMARKCIKIFEYILT